MKQLLFLLLLSTWTIVGMGQPVELAAPNESVTFSINKANAAFCKGDTMATLLILEAIEKQFPNDGGIVLTNRALGELYLQQGRAADAKFKLQYALFYQPTNYVGKVEDYYLDSPGCRQLLSYSYSRTKADVCFSLSKVYRQENQYDSAIYFLKLADSNYLPYRNCVNGFRMYQSFLSPYFADCYLFAGDTVKAINRLLEYFMDTNGNIKFLTSKLKSILLLKWTQEQINIEIRKALRTIRFVKDRDDGFQIYLTMFGYNIQDYGHGTKRLYRQWYKKHRSLAWLKG